MSLEDTKCPWQQNDICWRKSYENILIKSKKTVLTEKLYLLWKILKKMKVTDHFTVQKQPKPK